VVESSPDRDFFVFVHIPRTAGSSIALVLNACFPAGEVRSLGNIYKGGGGSRPRKARRLRESTPRVVTEGVRGITGHVPYGFTPHLPGQPRYVTILRDPVKRALSHYHGVLRRAEDTGSEIAGMTPEEVLADPDLIVDNIQTRMVAGVADATAEVDAATLEQAKQNLEQAFAAFGISERFDESAVLIAWALGVRTVPAVARRRRVTGMGEAVAPDSLRDTFVRRNTVDLELYTWAADLFDRRVDEAGAALQVEVARHRIARLNALFEEAQAAMAELHEQFVRLEAPQGGEATAADGPIAEP
jgi:hypothetical protein